MATFPNTFDDSKLYESIFGEDQRWETSRTAHRAFRALSDQWDAIASANKEAADRLVVGLRPGPTSESYFSYPIMSLYRHYLEMRLKGILFQLIGWANLAANGPREDPEQTLKTLTHNLMDVWRKVRELLNEIDRSELAIEGVREEADAKYNAIESRITEFSDIDKGATGFRYPVQRDGTATLGTPLSKEEMLQVKGVVEALEYYLAGISCGVYETSTAVFKANQGKEEKCHPSSKESSS